LDKDLQREGRRSAAMRTQEREIGGKRTESRERIGRSRRQRGGTKESAAATATRSQAQHRLITLLHTSDLSLSENTKKKKNKNKKNKQSPPSDYELRETRFSCGIR
jgi:hypothetical protein